MYRYTMKFVEADPEGEPFPREKPKEQHGLPAQKGQWKLGGQQYAGSLMKVAVPLGGLVSSHMSVRTARVVTQSLDVQVPQGQGRGRNSTREYCQGKLL